MNELYLLLFKQCFMYGTVIPSHSDIIWFAMQGFGGYDMALATFIAIAGTTAGTLANVLAGWLFMWLLKDMYGDMADTPYATGARFYNRFGMYMLLFTFQGPFHIFAIAAGMFKTHALTVILFIALGRSYYYFLNLFA